MTGEMTIGERVARLEAAVIEVARVGHNYGQFHAAAGFDPHEALEKVRVQLGDDDFADHLEKRRAARQAELTADEIERAKKKSDSDKISSLEAQLRDQAARMDRLLQLLDTKKEAAPAAPKG